VVIRCGRSICGSCKKDEGRDKKTGTESDLAGEFLGNMDGTAASRCFPMEERKPRTDCTSAAKHFCDRNEREPRGRALSLSPWAD